MVLHASEYIAVIASIVVSIALSYKSYKYGKNKRDGLPSTTGLSLWSIIASLIASNTSGVSFLGKPTEAYTYGIEFQFYLVLSLISQSILVVFLLWPVLSNLKGPSLYDYYEKRFNSKVKMLVSAQFVISRILITAIAALPPVMIIHHFSEIEFKTLTVLLIGITTFYTMLGDLRGVVLTDTFQSIVMLIALMVLCSLSVWEIGGATKIFQIAAETGRLLPPKASFDPRERFTLWAHLGCFVISSTFNQMSYQRFKLCSSKKDVNTAIVAQFAGMVVFSSGSCFLGLAMYAYYYGCDPKEAQLVSSYSNLVVYWLDMVGSKISGLRGLFIAGITCASISTISTNLNTVSAMLSQEIMKFKAIWGISSRFFHVRFVTVVVGIIVAVIAVIFRDTNSLIELMFGINYLEGMTSGILLLGMVSVRANANGALIGGLSGFATMFLLAIGSKIRSFTSKSVPNFKFMRTDLCPMNTTVIKHPVIEKMDQSVLSYILSFSPFLYPVVSLALTMAIGLSVSYAFPSEDDSKQDPDLYVSWVRKHLRQYTPVHMPRIGDDLTKSEQKEKDHLCNVCV